MLVSAALCAAAFAPLHDPRAHLQITREALDLSSRLTDAIEELGLEAFELEGARSTPGEVPVRFGTDRYLRYAARAGYRGLPATAEGFLLAGSVLEDGVGSGPWWLGGLLDIPSEEDFTSYRCTRHFQNTDGEGVRGPSYSSRLTAASEWGWRGEPEPSGADNVNRHTWLDAIDMFEETVAGRTSEARRDSAERMLVAIGCSLHLLQDQFSPAHTRDDPHPGHDVPIADFLLGHSHLEVEEHKYVNGLLDWNAFQDGGISQECRPTYSEFFRSAVEWTAGHFYSDDSYPSPARIEARGAVCDPSSSCAQNGGGLLGDVCTYLAPEPELAPAPRLGVQRRVLVSETMQPGVPPGVRSEVSIVGSRCDALGADSVIVDNLVHLVPKATSYSAGLLDHFFRGRLNLDRSSEGGLEITNRSLPIGDCGAGVPAGTPAGKIEGGFFEVYREEGNGDRSLLVRAPVQSGGLLRNETQVIFDARLDDVGNETLFVLLADGTIGGESGCATDSIEWTRQLSLCSVSGFRGLPVDVDGDGAEEYLFSTDAGSTDFQVLQFLGSTPVLSSWTPRPTKWQVLYRPVAAGRYDGDFNEDVLFLGFQWGPGRPGAEHFFWFSGADGGLLHAQQVLDPVPQGTPGACDGLSVLGDLDLDGLPELYKTACYDPTGTVTVYSGATGLVSRVIEIGWSLPDELAPGADWDGDGVGDFRSWESSGHTRIHSSANGSLLFSMSEYDPWLNADDLDGDLMPDWVGPYVEEKRPGTFEEGLAAWSIVDDRAVLIWKLPGVQRDDAIGEYSQIDVDGDGVRELVLFGDMQTLVDGDVEGLALVVVDLDRGSVVQAQFLGIPEGHEIAYDGRPRPAGDLDGDGRVDFVYFTQRPYFAEVCLRVLISQ